MVLAMAAIVVMQGCSSGNEGSAASSSGSASTPAESQQASSGASPSAPATAPSVDELEPVTLTWFYPGTPQPDDAEVFKRVNEIIYDKIKATVEFNPIDYGTYADKMKVKMAASEVFDLSFTAGWINPFEQNAASGAYLALDDLLPVYAPKTYETIPDFMWELGQSYKGKIYGVANYQGVAVPGGMWFKTDLVEKHNIDLSQIKIDMPKEDFYAVLSSYYDVIAKNEPGVWPIETFQEGFWGNVLPYDFTKINTYADAVRKTDHSQIVNTYDTPEFAWYMNLARDWYEKGYMRPDVISNVRASNNPDEKAGKYFSGFTTANPDQEATLEKAWGYDVTIVPTSKAELQLGNLATTVTAISRTSKHPERALMLIELMNTDKELYNTIAYGIEGKHYEKIGPNTVKVIPDSGYNPANQWMFGSQFNAYVTEGNPEDMYEKQREINESAVMGGLGTFKIDKTAINDQVGQIQSIIDEYSPGIASGAVDGAGKLKEMLSKMKSAGLQKIMDEDLKQLQAYKASEAASK